MKRPRTVSELTTVLRKFASDRDWNQFHSPKNLATALIVEAAELLEHFQWLTHEESSKVSGKTKAGISDEIADILIYLVRFCDVMRIDLLEAAFRKVEKNKLKYPVGLARGKATKYTQLRGRGKNARA